MQHLDYTLIDHYLQSEKSLIFPTETVYGLGCDAKSDRAVQNLLELTFRPQEKWITTLCDSMEMIEQYAVIRFESERHIMKKFMPWPLTIILDSKHVLSPLLEQSNGTIGVRIPDHDIVLWIIRHYGHGLATKSANITGWTPPTSTDMIDPYFIAYQIMIIDGWICPLRIASTIIRFHSEKEFEILRQGSITEEKIREVLSS
jgi:L-threonylcarbamoyladenylate synthase